MIFFRQLNDLMTGENPDFIENKFIINSARRLVSAVEVSRRNYRNCLSLSMVCVIGVMLFGTIAQAADEKSKPPAKSEGSGQIIMNVVEIKGKIDQPQAVYIINLAKPDFKGIKLEKDFTQSIKNEDFKGLESFKVDKSLPAEVMENTNK
jgi:hypothetical protein